MEKETKKQNGKNGKIEKQQWKYMEIKRTDKEIK